MSGSLCITHTGIKPCIVGSLRTCFFFFFFDGQFCEWWYEVGGGRPFLLFYRTRCLGFSLMDRNIIFNQLDSADSVETAETGTSLAASPEKRRFAFSPGPRLYTSLHLLNTSNLDLER